VSARASIPPDTDTPIGIGMFAPAKDKHRRPKTGRVAVRKRVVDPVGNELDVELSGFTFQVFDPASGQPVGGTFTTNSHGHAESPDLSTGTSLRLGETGFPSSVTPRGHSRSSSTVPHSSMRWTTPPPSAPPPAPDPREGTRDNQQQQPARP
jgi:hypothetical protein